MEVFTRCKQELLEQSSYSEDGDEPESWRVLEQDDGYVARGRWTDTDELGFPNVYYDDVTLSEALEPELEARFATLRASTTVDTEALEPERRECSVEERACRLVPSDDPEQSFAGAIRYAITGPFQHTVAHQKMGEMRALAHGDALPEEIGEYVAYFDDGRLSKFTVEIDGDRMMYFAEELSQPVLGGAEATIQHYVSTIETTDEASITCETLAFTKHKQCSLVEETKKPQERAEVTVHSPL